MQGFHYGRRALQLSLVCRFEMNIKEMLCASSRNVIRGKITGRTGRCFPPPQEQQVFQTLEGMMRLEHLKGGGKDGVCLL